MRRGLYAIRHKLYEVATYAKAWHFASGVERSLLDADKCLLIYQMGRVASQTVNDTAAAALPGVPVFHVHWLSEENLSRAEARARSRYGMVRQRHILVARRLRQFLEQRGLGGLQWWIVTLVRDPVARNLSEFFLTLEEYQIEGAFRRYRENPDVLRQWIDDFVSGYDHLSRCHWFEEEIGRVFGIDVYSQPFDHQCGFSLIEQDGVRVLVLRQEDLDRGLKSGFKALTGVAPAGQVVARHVSGQDPNADLYRELRCRLRMPAELLDRIYDCRWVRHFYSKEEISEWRQRWLAGS